MSVTLLLPLRETLWTLSHVSEDISVSSFVTGHRNHRTGTRSQSCCEKGRVHCRNPPG